MLGDLLKEKREKRGVSLTKAASAIGITKSHLHDLEKGRSNNPCLSLLISLMGYYNISWGEIIRSWNPD